MTRAKRHLELLRDMEASRGSFLIGTDNEVLVRDASEDIPTTTLSALGRRDQGSLAALDQRLPDAYAVSLIFDGGIVIGHRCMHGTVVLMGGPDLHIHPARIAMGVSAYRLDQMATIEATAEESVSTVEPEDTKAPKRWRRKDARKAKDKVLA